MKQLLIRHASYHPDYLDDSPEFQIYYGEILIATVCLESLDSNHMGGSCLTERVCAISAFYMMGIVYHTIMQAGEKLVIFDAWEDVFKDGLLAIDPAMYGDVLSNVVTVETA